MAAKLSSVKVLVEENDTNMAKSALEILCKLTKNVINHPENAKYRRVRLSNAIVEEKLLPTIGAMECLFEIGFEEDGEYLQLPQSVSAAQLSSFHQVLQLKLDSLCNSSGTFNAAPLAPLPSAPQRAAVARPPQRSQLVSESNFRSQFDFLRRLQSSAAHVMVYEQPLLQRQALSCIPATQLTERGIQRLQDLGDQAGGLDVQDMVLLELLAWFKQDFFRWMDAPLCASCGARTVASGMATPTQEDLRWGASRVEAYTCSACSRPARFPRYNHPGKLLETRAGRCGEWANCFTLCCRAMGFEARHVLDWTDHVWSEVYSQSQGRWLHCDPCENTCDKPLMYETGWGKKLSYVIAFSKDDVQDVSWRYSGNHAEMLKRRQECSERWLIKTFMNMTKERQAHLTESRRKVLLDRQVIEILELLTERTAGSGELTGRLSGSQAWRRARGELGEQPQASAVITASPSEISSGRIELKYCCASDQYMRGPNQQVVRGWGSLTHNVEAIHRKEENDWNMVYLARREGSNEASISWKIDLNDSQHVIGELWLSVQSEVFESGQVTWLVCSDSQCARLQPDGELRMLEDFAGEKQVTITAHLSRGKGDLAWQHTQLFRQGLSEKNRFPFVVKVFLKK